MPYKNYDAGKNGAGIRIGEGWSNAAFGDSIRVEITFPGANVGRYVLGLRWLVQLARNNPVRELPNDFPVFAANIVNCGVLADEPETLVVDVSTAHIIPERGRRDPKDHVEEAFEICEALVDHVSDPTNSRVSAAA